MKDQKVIHHANFDYQNHTSFTDCGSVVFSENCDNNPENVTCPVCKSVLDKMTERISK